MGRGGYDVQTRSMRAFDSGYHTKGINEIFKSRSINNAMNPKGVRIRESRDSDEHPNSLAIMFGMDETGSMGKIPHMLVRDGLPKIMSKIMEAGEKDPQVLFMGIGDHKSDAAPLQVAQFESNDELLDKWLTDVYLEANGGGNGGESYLLAWYFAAFHTSLDCWEKRKRKGFLFTIGDEPTHDHLPASVLRELMGDGEYKDYTAVELLNKARETFNVFHIHLTETMTGQRQEYKDFWKNLMGEEVIYVNNHFDIAAKIAEVITTFNRVNADTSTATKTEGKVKISL